MSFSLQSFLGRSETITEHDFLEGVSFDGRADRETEVLHKLADALSDLGQLLGGHVSVSCYGHLNPQPAPGDNVVINANAVPEPGGPTVPVQSAPAAQPVEPSATSTATTSAPLEAAQPGGSTAPVADAGLTQPSAEPVPAPAAPVGSQGPDLGPSAVEVSDVSQEALADQGAGAPAPAATVEQPVAPTEQTPEAPSPVEGTPVSEPTLAATEDTTAQDVRAEQTAAAPEPSPPSGQAQNQAAQEPSPQPEAAPTPDQPQQTW